ncbi:ABC transporter H family member 2-like [Mya arenaria]|uniref:ABC transporter H family member 2-like n=1 Tax=Mya arenaria TaxID=6604 RepID=UPI0022E30586|nr:ABC transporter H family member 2-like [Mya arenaria]XP_052769892.1 ABC transporter H family member 2-like [Mya arenaria]
MQLSISSGSLAQSFRPVTWKFAHYNKLGSNSNIGMTTDMLKFLTKKLKSQSLSEGQNGNHPEDADDEERDSGTESDDNFDDDIYGSNTSLNDLTRKGNNNNNNNNSRDSLQDNGKSSDLPAAKTHEISEHNFDTVSCTSDYERQSLDFDRHSSEDELGSINKENVAEKRKWSDVHCSGCCDSAGESDDEVKEFLLTPQPVLLSSSPPKGVQRVRVYTKIANQTQRQVLARMAPITVTSVSPRKRHRLNYASDNVYDSDSGPATQRPCLDFEKMQQVQAFV